MAGGVEQSALKSSGSAAAIAAGSMLPNRSSTLAGPRNACSIGYCWSSIIPTRRANGSSVRTWSAASSPVMWMAMGSSCLSCSHARPTTRAAAGPGDPGLRTDSHRGDAMTHHEPPHHAQLPLPDYDHLPTGSLEGRIRTLDSAGVEALLAYEQAHAHRLPVVQLLSTRL